MEDIFFYAVCAVFAVAVVGAIVTPSPKAQLAKMGNLKGKTKAEIFSKLGKPNAVSAAPDGKTICQWFETSSIFGSYHVALLFDGDICEGVTHEFQSNPGL